MRVNASLDIRLNQFQENLSHLRKIAPNKNILFMIKANGYGHGDKQLYSYALKHQLLKWFGVATLGEAIQLRRNFPYQESEIFVFSDAEFEDRDSRDVYLQFHLTPVLHNEEWLDLFLKSPEFSKFPLVLKFDVGMHRLGIPWERAEQVAEKISTHGRKMVSHAMAHLSNASQAKDNQYNLEQHERFESVLKLFRDRGILIEHTSLSNSAAIEHGIGLEYTTVRPGLMLYGPSSLLNPDDRIWEGKLLGRFRARILRKMEHPKGTGIGYGQCLVPGEGPIYVLALGYADGIRLAMQGVVFQSEQGEFEIIGRPNMDLLFLQHRPGSGKTLQVGDWITFWDKEPQELRPFVQGAKSSPYELFCSIGARIPRNYQMQLAE